jgi:hypothetical protein
MALSVLLESLSKKSTAVPDGVSGDHRSARVSCLIYAKGFMILLRSSQLMYQKCRHRLEISESNHFSYKLSSATTILLNEGDSYRWETSQAREQSSHRSRREDSLSKFQLIRK